MVLVLFCVTLISSAAVAYVNSLTITSINKAKEAKQADAIRQVIPGAFNNDPVADTWKVETDGGVLEFFPAKQDGETVGTAVKTYTKNGFGGEVWLMVGFNPDGSISNYSVLEHKETPGLGSKMDQWFTKEGKGSIIGKKTRYGGTESEKRRRRCGCHYSGYDLFPGIFGCSKPGVCRFSRKCRRLFGSNPEKQHT